MIGLGTEFMTKKEASTYYKNGIKSYDEIVQDFHRSRYVHNIVQIQTTEENN